MLRDFEHDALSTVEYPVMVAVETIFKVSGNKPIFMSELIHEVQKRCKERYRYTSEELSKASFIVKDLLRKHILERASVITVRMAETYWQALKVENEMLHRTVPYWPEVIDWNEC